MYVATQQFRSYIGQYLMISWLAGGQKCTGLKFASGSSLEHLATLNEVITLLALYQ